MNSITFRKATLEDVPTLLRFEQELIDFERSFDSNLKPKPVNYYDLNTLITSEHIEILVAEHNSKIIASGYAKIVSAKQYHINPKYAYLGFMFVIPDYRGQGINAKLIDLLIGWSKSKGITEARLEVYAENGGAIKAYEKVGFNNHMMEMKLKF